MEPGRPVRAVPERRSPSRWWVVLAAALLTLGALGSSAAHAAAQGAFAALTVEPNGSQRFDILSGVTTLPEGGTIVDRDLGVTLLAERIEYRAQEYVKAWGVKLTGAFGEVTADSMNIDQLSGRLNAAGGLRLVREGLTVSAGSLEYDAAAEIATFEGGVEGTEPTFTADRVLLDVTSGDVLLEGEYLFEGGLFAMRSPEGGGMLALKLVEADGVISYDAATEVPSELLARFAAHL